MKRFGLALVFCAALSLAAVPAYAGGIDFSSSGIVAGAVDFNPSVGGTASGSGIPITTVSFNSSSDAVTGKKCGQTHTPCGQLAFTTGNFITSGVNGSNQQFDEFAGGGSITLVGKVPGGSVTTLVTAVFNGPVFFTQTSPTMLTMTSNITVTSVSPSVLALFPGVQITPNGTLTLTINGRFFKDHGFNGHSVNPNLFIQTTPEPSGMILLGTGLLGLAGLLRKKERKNS